MFFTQPAPSEIYTLSLHDALPIWARPAGPARGRPEEGHGPDRRLSDASEVVAALGGPPGQGQVTGAVDTTHRSEEHTSELQSRFDLVCRLLLEKKKKCRTTLAAGL